MKQKKDKKERVQFELHPLIRIPVSLIVVAVLLFLSLSAVKFCAGLFLNGDFVVSLPWSDSPIIQQVMQKPGKKDPTPTETPEDGAPVIRHATIAVAGDIMTHMPVVNSGATKKGYDYTEMYKFLKPYVDYAGYAAVTLESTFAGTDNGNSYTGSPRFNAPDAVADGIKNAGFDLVLTANEHANDYGTFGMKRTLDILKNRKLDSLGTSATSETEHCLIREIGGIQVGQIAYTFADTSTGRDTPTINDKALDSSAAGLLHAFDYDELDLFYKEMEDHIQALRERGAEALVLYLHWGNEYSLKIGSRQKEMAQKLCDMGIDVIAGSHTHTVQPMELLTSTEGNHKTLCIYSLGNLVSNQRANNSKLPSGHGEDGLMVTFTLAADENGEVWVESMDALPIWVLLRGTGSSRFFQILPLDSELNWKTTFQLSTDELKDAQDSYERTSEIINASVKSIQESLIPETEPAA